MEDWVESSFDAVSAWDEMSSHNLEGSPFLKKNPMPLIPSLMLNIPSFKSEAKLTK